MRIHPVLRAAVPGVFVLALLTCGKSPTQNTPPATTPTTVPATTPTTVPVQTTCTKLGLGNPSARCGERTSGEFQSQVDAAIGKVQAQHPDVFEVGGSGLRTVNFGKFTTALIDNLNNAGLCGGFDGEEVQVANVTDFSEQYKIITSQGYVRIGSSYKSTCNPAAFPTPAPGKIPPPAGCSLPSSNLVACGPSAPSYIGDINEVIDQVVRDHPEVFNTNDVLGQNGYAIRDVPRYHALVASTLTQRGLCGWFDGEEMTVKRTNEYTDHYDIVTGDDHIRRGNGQYRTSCYPAAF